jgi:hypothetical protein
MTVIWMSYATYYIGYYVRYERFCHQRGGSGDSGGSSGEAWASGGSQRQAWAQVMFYSLYCLSRIVCTTIAPPSCTAVHQRSSSRITPAQMPDPGELGGRRELPQPTTNVSLPRMVQIPLPYGCRTAALAVGVRPRCWQPSSLPRSLLPVPVVVEGEPARVL